jgi:hypothetical protein
LAEGKVTTFLLSAMTLCDQSTTYTVSAGNPRPAVDVANRVILDAHFPGQVNSGKQARRRDVEMSEGFGDTLPSGDWTYEGFSFNLAGIDGQLTITPDSLVWPSLGNSPSNQVSLKIGFSGCGFAADVIVAGPLSMLHVLLDDLERLLSGDEQALEFPSARAVEFLHPQFTCRLVRDQSIGEKWLLHCQFAIPSISSVISPGWLSHMERGRLEATLTASLHIETSSVAACPHSIRKFLVWIENAGSDAPNDM